MINSRLQIEVDLMELHDQHIQLEASSTLNPQQMEVLRLYQLCGIDISNEKFQVSFSVFNLVCKTLFQALWQLVTMRVPTSDIVKLLIEISKSNHH